MSSDEWFGELSQTLQCDSTWSPTIVLPIVLIPSMEKATTDIVLYFNSPSPSKNIEAYPLNSPFYFDGYYGIDAEKNLLKSIIDSAHVGGTFLSYHRRTNASNDRLVTIEIFCKRKIVSRSTVNACKVKETSASLQLEGTSLQFHHAPSSTKGASRDSKKQYKLDSSDNTPNHSLKKKSKATTNRPLVKGNKCNFQFSIVLYKDERYGNKWYYTMNQTVGRREKFIRHDNHLKPVVNHIQRTYHDLDLPIQKELDLYCVLNMSYASITDLLKVKYQVSVSKNTVQVAREKYNASYLESIGCKDVQSNCMRLIEAFKSNPCVSFMYVLHDIKSGYVTMRRNRKDDQDSNFTSTPTDEDELGVDHVNVLNWRNKLQVGDKDKILVSLAWVTDDEMRNGSMFPEFMAVDVTFGTCKEQRNLLRFVGVNGSLKTFDMFNCYMPSKQLVAFRWACKVAFVKLVHPNVLKWNRCIATDEESNMYVTLREMMLGGKILKKSCHRLDKFHLFTKEWLDNVCLYVYMFYFCNIFVIVSIFIY